MLVARKGVWTGLRPASVAVGAFALLLSLMLAGVGSASALPEYKTCIKATGGGEFSNKECTAAAPGGKYKLGAWNEGKKHTFKVKSSSSKFYLVNPIEESNAELNPGKTPKGAVGAFTASGSKAKGELTGPSSSTFTEEFKKVKFGAKNCNSPGQGKGKVKTFELETHLIELASGSKQGELVFAATPNGLLAEFQCEGIEVKVRGAFFLEIVGASAGATKVFHLKAASREGNPNNLPTYLKVLGVGTALEEEGANDDIEKAVCVKKKVGEGVAKLTAESECFAKYINGDAEAESFASGPGPLTLESTVLKFAPTPVELPVAQNTEAEVKGEAVLIK